MSDLIERSARYLARKGEAAVSQHLAIVERARELLAKGEVAPFPLAQPAPLEPFAWQFEEADHRTPRSIWSASVEESSTGEGIVGHFMIGLFRCEAEVRRRLAAELGVWFADAAAVSNTVESPTAASFFASEELFAALGAMASDPHGPGEATYVARYSMNYE